MSTSNQSLTWEQWTARHARMRELADRYNGSVVDRMRQMARQAGLDPSIPSLHAHNALCSLDHGDPWPGVDYSLVRRILWLSRDVQWRAHSVVERWVHRTYPAATAAARGHRPVPAVRPSQADRAVRPLQKRGRSARVIPALSDPVDYLGTGMPDLAAAKRYLRNKHRQQPLEPQVTPPAWRSYVSAVNGSRRGLLLGPYASDMMAPLHVARGETLARAADPRAHFYAYGTCSMAPEVAALVTPVFGR